ncbi:MAG: TauD/TfdA family dioxygenase [Xenococcaceae cyanobacterium]
MKQLETVKYPQEVALNENFLTVGSKRFHYVWLRDNCLSPKCHHASSFQKIYDISDRVDLPKPKSAFIRDEKLIVDWDETPPHCSTFPLVWLLSHAYDGEKDENGTLPAPDSQLGSEKILWDKAELAAKRIEWPDFLSCTFESWIDQLDALGFTVLRNMAWDNLESFVSGIGPVYELSRFGRYSTVKAIPNGQDLALSRDGNALSPHTDLTYIPAPPVVQLLYCVENQSSGGESILVDGFRVARDFRSDRPDYFQILSATQVQFRQFYQQWNYFVSHKTPIIKLDDSGEVASIHFCHKNFGLNIPFDEMESFYEAYRTFTRYLKNPAYQYWLRLEPGDCLLVQNFRVLHGRNAFDPSYGTRHLESTYIEWIYFSGRRDFEHLKPLYMTELPISNS